MRASQNSGRSTLPELGRSPGAPPPLAPPHPRRPLLRVAGPPAIGHAPLITAFPIANPRLEFQLSGKDFSHFQISNRERIAIPCPPWPMGILRRVVSFFSSPQPPAHGLQNPRPPWPARCGGPVRLGGRLIVTPRLEFPASHSKETACSIPNRYKLALSYRVDSPRPMRSLYPGRISVSGTRVFNPDLSIAPLATKSASPRRAPFASARGLIFGLAYRNMAVANQAAAGAQRMERA